MTTVWPSTDRSPYEIWLDKIQTLPEPSRSQMLEWAQQQAVRSRSLVDYPTPAFLAASIEPNYVLTPAIRLLGSALEQTLRTRRGRLLITMPPQEGKTELTAVWTVLRALQQNPERRVILASYSADLAEESSQRARNIIQTHGTGARDPLTGQPVTDKLGLNLAEDKARSAHWQLKGHRGGMIAVGFGGTITGRPADVLLIDDPLKGMQSADSATERRRVIAAFQGDLTTRLAPDAPIILIQTRWHEDDLAGWILAREKELPPEARTWRHINIPAQAERGIPDALGREPGQWLESSRHRRFSDWEETKRNVGERVWYALYQGVPTPTAGGLFHTDWFTRYRVGEEPEDVAVRIVSVDPAETGKGDEAGVLGMSVTGNGVVYVTDDESGLMQSDEWARASVLLALKNYAGEILFEAFTTGPTYERVINDAWKRVRNEAMLLRSHDGDVEAAARVYAERDYAPADPLTALRQVAEVHVPEGADAPFRVQPWRAPGDKVARSVGARQGAATGRLRMVGRHVELEKQAVTWQPGQGSPDRVDALANGHDRLRQMVGMGTQISTPVGGKTTLNRNVGPDFWSSHIG